MHDLVCDPRFLRKRVKRAGFQSLDGLPRRSKGKVVGVMDVAAMDRECLSAEDVALLGRLGNPIGVAIEDTRLYGQLQEMSVLEERR